MTVLVADPDQRSRRLTVAALRHGGFAVETARTPAHVLSLVRRRPVDAVVLDPADPDPVETVHDLRRRTEVPIIVVSAIDDERGKVAVLDAGADDYLCKPFGIEELLARVRAALRRTTHRGEEPPVSTAHFQIDLAAHRVHLSDGREAHLTATEWRIVETLVRHAGHVVGHPQLLEETWGAKGRDKTNYLRVYLASIRRKLEPQPARPRYFITYQGLGHSFLSEGAGYSTQRGAVREESVAPTASLDAGGPSGLSGDAEMVEGQLTAQQVRKPRSKARKVGRRRTS